MTRAERRHESQRAKERARRVIAVWEAGSGRSGPSQLDDPTMVGRLARTRKLCACCHAENRPQDKRQRIAREQLERP